MPARVAALLFFLLCCGIAPALAQTAGGKVAAGPRENLASAGEEARLLGVLTEDGGRLDWLGGRIAFDRPGSDGYFDLWVMDEDGANQRNLTRGAPGLPRRHKGNPAWHPSGRWIAFQAQKDNLPRYVDRRAAPGQGVLNDLWLAAADGSAFWRLRAVGAEVSRRSAGVLHPCFSPDGNWLAWAERIGSNDRSFGTWQITVAPFTPPGEGGAPPALGPARAYRPAGAGGRRNAFYEPHAFSPDGQRLLFTGDQDASLDIYELTLKTGAARRMTNTPLTWDEHARYAPDGGSVVWMSSAGLPMRTRPFRLRTEYWRMSADGSGAGRLTAFNTPGHPHHKWPGEDICAADFAFSADGRRMAALLVNQPGNTDQHGHGRIVLLELPPMRP